MDPHPESPAIPSELEAKYDPWTWELVWQYGPEALTYRLSDDSGEVRFLKMTRADWFPPLSDEAARMRWAVDYLPVPPVLEPALALARRRLDEGRIEPARDFHPEFSHLSAREAIEQLERTRPGSEQLMVCHGDYCLPNVLIEADSATGFVDLGELGVADRWWDLAVATWSVTWNLGPGYEDLFLREYGIEWDHDRVEFYRLLYDVVS